MCPDTHCTTQNVPGLLHYSEFALHYRLRHDVVIPSRPYAHANGGSIVLISFLSQHQLTAQQARSGHVEHDGDSVAPVVSTQPHVGVPMNAAEAVVAECAQMFHSQMHAPFRLSTYMSLISAATRFTSSILSQSPLYTGWVLARRKR